MTQSPQNPPLSNSETIDEIEKEPVENHDPLASSGNVTATQILTISDEISKETDTKPDPIIYTRNVPMVLIPAGTFLRGSSDGNSDQQPERTITLDAFYIDQYEITNAQFVSFLSQMDNKKENGVQWVSLNQFSRIYEYGGIWWVKKNYENHPVVGVTWYGARAYCEWRGTRLPTEAEWEKAARGTDGRTYPWGDQNPDNLLLNFNLNERTTTPVGSYPKGVSPYGISDMAGNVWEWVSDWYNPNYYGTAPDENPLGPSTGTERVLRGGGFGNKEGVVKTTNRVSREPNTTTDEIGVRCAISP